MTFVWRSWLFMLTAWLCMAGGAKAQISPGKLARPHAKLEGLTNCTQCHELGAGVSSSKCRQCHIEIHSAMQDESGYHFRVVERDKKECWNCHPDHAGESFELVHWPEGEKKFDHELAGFPLAGKHKTTECRDCHKAERVRTALQDLSDRVDFDKTYLGLRRACVSCHADVHRDQLGPNCSSCHDQETWRTASLFDHGKSRFPLTGKHTSLKCSQCHTTLSGKSTGNAGIADVLYKPIPHQDCASCHRDVHKARFEAACKTCHATTGWRQVDQAAFDHDKTRFPLRDKHARVACRQCHKSGDMTAPLAFRQCASCHADVHKGKLGKNCQECHSSKGWGVRRKTGFDHARTRFPLLGRHFEVSCEKCHKSRNLVSPMAFDRCDQCHADAHNRQFAGRTDAGRCESCHNEDGFVPARYDSRRHAETEFPLSGAHLATPCIACHERVMEPDGKSYRNFTFAGTGCETCHDDTHRGQFSQAAAPKNCQVCHKTSQWTALQFDHDRDSRYKLVGTHKKVSCAGCHKQVGDEHGTYVRYKPLDQACKSCHTQNVIKL